MPKCCRLRLEPLQLSSVGLEQSACLALLGQKLRDARWPTHANEASWGNMGVPVQNRARVELMCCSPEVPTAFHLCMFVRMHTCSKPRRARSAHFAKPSAPPATMSRSTGTSWQCVCFPMGKSGAGSPPSARPGGNFAATRALPAEFSRPPLASPNVPAPCARCHRCAGPKPRPAESQARASHRDTRKTKQKKRETGVTGMVCPFRSATVVRSAFTSFTKHGNLSLKL